MAGGGDPGGAGGGEDCDRMHIRAHVAWCRIRVSALSDCEKLVVSRVFQFVSLSLIGNAAFAMPAWCFQHHAKAVVFIWGGTYCANQCGQP